MAAYRPGVLVGNWKEEACLEEVGEQRGLRSNLREPRLPLLLAVLPPVLLKADVAAPGNAVFPLLKQERLRDFMQKRERGELLMQKINRLKDNLLKKVIFKGFVSPSRPCREQQKLFVGIPNASI